jgi:spermidine synthase
MGTDELESYTKYDYDKCARLIKESDVYMVNTSQIFVTEHKYQNGHNNLSDVYVREVESNNIHLRELLKTYDDDNNLIIVEINELEEYSTQPSRVLKYEYYNE